jgi:hypothetical protein
MADLTDEQRRALRIVARHLDGCAEEVLLAEGFSVGQVAARARGNGRDEARTGWQSPQGLVEDHRGGPEGDRGIGVSPTNLASRTPREKPIKYIDIPVSTGQAGTSGFSASPLTDRQPVM